MRKRTAKSQAKLDYLSAWNWPTLDELRDVTRSSQADTINQILKGQGIYYGYEIEREVDNDIPGPGPTAMGPEQHFINRRKSHETQRLKYHQEVAIKKTAQFLKISKQEAYELLKRNGGV